MLRCMFIATFWSMGAVLGVVSAEDTTRPPNVVFILADDLGWMDLGCQGSTYYETPAIDRLAEQGVRLTSYYHCHNCAPTRAALLSGQYAPRTGIYNVGDMAKGIPTEKRLMRVPTNHTELPLEIKTFAEPIRDAGYATAMFGKWHLGKPKQYHPSKRGFDQAIVSSGRHFNFVTDPRQTIPKGAYLADWLTDHAVEFIREHKDEPFLLYLPHFGVHSPLEAKKEWIEHFRDKPTVRGQRNPVYAGMIASVDESVGRVMKTLDELGLADNTVLVFTSDNGGVGGYAPNVPYEQRKFENTDNLPLRGGKGESFDGGVRVPMIVRWPGRIPAGTTTDEPAIHVDWYPTLLELTRADRPSQIQDGVSLLPILRDPSAKLDREAIYWHYPGYLQRTGRNTKPYGAVRAGRYKLIENFEDGRLELFDLNEDIGETRNLVDELPEVTSRLHDLMLRWRAETKALMPTPIDASS